MGFLYSRGYEDINIQIAAGERDLYTITSEILKQRASMPTVSIDPMVLAEEYNLTMKSAEEIAEMASRHQSGSDLQPLSLIDIYSRGDNPIHPDEMLLRMRAAELGESLSKDVATYEAIQQICQTLMQEGFDRISADYAAYADYADICGYMEERLADVLEPDVLLDVNVVKYHCLLIRTGGRAKWTLRRGTGESKVRPYIPLLLWACDNKMSAEVCFNSEEIVREHVGRSAVLSNRELERNQCT